MSFDKFFDLLLMVYVTMIHILQRVSIYHAIITKIVLKAQEKGLSIGLDSIIQIGSPPSPHKSSPTHRARRKTFDDDQDLGDGGLDQNNLETNQWAVQTDSKAGGTVFGSLITDSASLLASACDLAHVRCAKLIGVRSDQNSILNPNDFYRFYAATWDFIIGAESVTGRICFGLKGTLFSQVRIFNFKNSRQRRFWGIFTMRDPSR